jgi:hypothetical protein
MKSRLFLAFAVLVTAAASPAPAQLLPKSSLTLDAKALTAGSGAKTGASTYWVRDRSYESGFVVEVALRTLGREPVKAELEWFFTAKPMAGGKSFVFDKGSKELEVVPGPGLKEVLESETVSGRRADYNYYGGGRVESGQKKEGWIIRVKENGVVTRIKASSTTLEAIAKDQVQLDSLIKRQEKR